MVEYQSICLIKLIFSSLSSVNYYEAFTSLDESVLLSIYLILVLRLLFSLDIQLISLLAFVLFLQCMAYDISIIKIS